MNFQTGTKVMAVKEITNQEGTRLEIGEKATIRGRYPHDAESARVIDLELPDGSLLRDIVVCIEGNCPVVEA